MSPHSPCDAAATCSSSHAASRECLTVPIPAWRGVDYERITCCLRCCLLGWIERLGLTANYDHWRGRGVNFYASNGGGGQRTYASPPPREMPIDAMLLTRFAIGRFAHFLAIESRDLVSFKEMESASTLKELRRPQFRVPHHLHKRANGSLVVLNGWGHSNLLLSRIVRTLPAGPIAMLYGDDVSWTAAEMEDLRSAMGPSRLVRHFAMNVDSSAVRLSHVSQVPIGLNAASMDLPDVLRANGALQSSFSHRSSRLLCCCQRAWPQREAAFAALRLAGHAHCNLTDRKPYSSLIQSYLRHRFVVSVHGHGRTDFREWEILTSGAVPVIDYFEEHDDLFDGLPVVRVRDWSAVTPEFLDAKWERLQVESRAGRVDWRKVYLPYWFARYTEHMTPSVA